MKRYRLQRLYDIALLFILLSCGFLSGCNDDSLDSSLQFSDDNLLLNAAGDTIEVTVTAGSPWSAESMAQWCQLDKNSGGASDKLVIYVSPSNDIYERGTAVKVNCGENVMRISIRQKPMEFSIADEKKSLQFIKKNSTDTLDIRTNMNWTVEIADTTGWLQVADTAGNGNCRLVFTTQDNSAGKERNTTVRIRYGMRSIKLAATQKGGIRADGHIQKHFGEREVKDGFNIIFLGDGFIDKDLVSETGAFDKAVEEATKALFNTEPYRTHKQYFNVYSIACESQERIVPGKEEPKTVFQTAYDKENRITGRHQVAFGHVSRIIGMNEDILKTNTVVAVLVNSETYGGSTYWYKSGKTISYVPLNRDTQLPGGFTNIFLHEVGGHAIGKLADEWSDPDKLLTPADKITIQTGMRSLYYYNLGVPPMPGFDYPQYMWGIWEAKEEYKGVMVKLPGGFGASNNPEEQVSVFHSEKNSSMLNNLPYFNATSRYAIMQYVLFKLNVFSFDMEGMQKLKEYFLKHDTFTIPEAMPESEKPQLPMPEWIEE